MVASTTVRTSGPFFGDASGIMDSILDDAKEHTAQVSYDRVQQRLGTVLKHPTGYLQSRITQQRRADTNTVEDGVVYGAWIEGVGSRNKTTRFKGYHTFRTVAQDVQAHVAEIAGEVIARQMGRLN